MKLRKQKRSPLQTAAYRDLSSATVYRMSEEEAHEVFCQARWGSSDRVGCPGCGLIDNHYKRRQRRQWRCKACHRCFSVTSGTPFANRKLPLTELLPIFYEFAGSQKGASALALSGQLDVTVMTAFHNFSKLREVTFETQDKTQLEGVVQIDGGHFCGKPRKPNKRTKANPAHVNSRLNGRKQSIIPVKNFSNLEPWNQEKLRNRRIVVVLRQLYPEGSEGVGAVRTITEVVLAEDAQRVLPMLNKYVATNSIVQTDGGHAYRMMDPSKFVHQFVMHTQEYCTDDGVNNNQAESLFARLRRAEWGIHHGMRAPYMAMYAADAAWREDTRRMTRSERFRDVIKRAMRSGRSRGFWRYKQKQRLEGEHVFEPSVATGE